MLFKVRQVSGIWKSIFSLMKWQKMGRFLDVTDLKGWDSASLTINWWGSEVGLIHSSSSWENKIFPFELFAFLLLLFKLSCIIGWIDTALLHLTIKPLAKPYFFKHRQKINLSSYCFPCTVYFYFSKACCFRVCLDARYRNQLQLA